MLTARSGVCGLCGTKCLVHVQMGMALTVKGGEFTVLHKTK